MILIFWTILKILFYFVLIVVGFIFIKGFVKGFKEATCLFYNYSTSHVIHKKNKDGLVYELEKERKTFSQT